MPSVADSRRPLDALAVGSMLLLAAIWGFQQVAIKLAAPDVPLLLQGAIRSAVATACVVGWSMLRGVALLGRDRSLVPGSIAGLLFAVEFALIYAGLAWTTAARMVVFVYLAPCLTALGLALFVPGERLSRLQWTGVALAFAGVVAAFAEGFAAARGPTALGDACGIAAAFLWAATTILIRATSLTRVSAPKVLLYQLGWSAALLAVASVALGEPAAAAFTPRALASLAYQSVVVAFASYLTWFWLLTRYLASRLSVFSFATPFFGVAFGHLVLGDPVSAAFAGSALLVGAGIALVNWRPRAAGALSGRRR